MYTLEDFSFFGNKENIQIKHSISDKVKKEEDKIKIVSDGCLRFSHLNVRSLCSKFDVFSELIADEDYDIVGLSETWLHSGINDSDLYIEGYNIIRKDRGSRGGGVAFYVKNSLKFKILSTPPSNSSLEHLWIHLKVQDKNLCLGSLYRPPNTNLNSCIHDLENTLIEFIPNYDYVVFAGDLNVDFCNIPNTGYSYLSNFFNKYGLHQLVTDPTHVTDSSKTLIDLIISSNKSICTITDVATVDHISDHCLVYTLLSFPKIRSLIFYRSYRNFKKFNSENFSDDISSIDWSTFYSIENVNGLVDFFNSKVQHIFDIHAPITRSRITKSPSPWISENLRLLIKFRKKALSKYKKFKTTSNWEDYRNLRNFVTMTIRNEKKSYLRHIFETDPKGFWKTLKYLNINNSPKASPDSVGSPSEFNQYYLTCVPSVDLGNNSFIEDTYKDQFHDNSANEFNFAEVDSESITKIISQLTSNAKGLDGMDLRMLLLILPHLTDEILFIINTALKSNVFPLKWKAANIIPVPKISNPTKICEFRPISLLPILSKVLEKVMQEQLTNYFNTHDVFSLCQSGFRSFHSTTTALLKVSDDILTAEDKGENTVLILLDYSKAFDTLDHNILLLKLRYFGLSENAIKLMKSYLTDRVQRVVIGEKSSEFLNNKKGVFQGSILGPSLFTVYTADFAKSIKFCSIHQFADDIQIYFSFPSKNTCIAVNQINTDLQVIVEVSKSHGLLLNGSKTQMILFGKNRNAIIGNEDFSIKIDNNLLTPIDSARNLGLYFDSRLRFDYHISTLIQKSYRKLHTLYMNKDYLTTNIKLRLCETLILSAIAYCDTVYWPALTSNDKRSLQKIQNSCLKFSYGKRKYDHVTPLLDQSEWFTLDERYVIHMSSLTYKLMFYGIPKYLTLKLIRNCDVHSRETRHKWRFSIPKHKSSKFQRSFSYNSVKIFNSLPPTICSSCSVSSFKKAIKKFIYEKREHP